MTGYLDIDFANYIDNKKVTLRFIFILAIGVFFYKNIKQSLIASSKMEVEFVVCFEITNKLMIVKFYVRT